MYYKNYQTRVKLNAKAKNKYGACRTAGFDSKKEYRRFLELELLEKAGEVSNIEKQVTFNFYGKNGNKICSYKADFVYLEKDGTKVIEDVKAPITCTPVFRLKWKLLEDMFCDEIKKGDIKLLINMSR